MELCITELINHPEYDPRYISGSVFELGKDAAKTTWQNALDMAEKIQHTDLGKALLECRSIISNYFFNSTDLTWEELNNQCPLEYIAYCIQWITGDYREALDLDEDDPNYPGHIYKTEDGNFYYYFGE